MDSLGGLTERRIEGLVRGQQKEKWGAKRIGKEKEKRTHVS